MVCVSVQALHHVQLAIPPGSEDRARAFWSGLLGCEEVDKPAELRERGGCWFRSGSLEIHLGVEPAFRPAAKAHPGILVRDIQALAARLEAHGVAITWDAGFSGFDRFYCVDPFGNRLEFLEPVAR